MQNRHHHVRDYDGRGLPLFRLQAGTYDALVFPVDHALFRLEKLPRHHAAVDHEEDVAGQLLPCPIAFPQRPQLRLRKRRTFRLGEVREHQKVGEIGGNFLLSHSPLVQVRQQHLYISGRVVGRRLLIDDSLQVADRQHTNVDISCNSK